VRLSASGTRQADRIDPALPEGLTHGEIDAVVSARIAAGEDLYRLHDGALSDLDPDVVLRPPDRERAVLVR
jgi:hypothetical protein